MGRLKIGSFVLYSNSIDSAKQNLMSCFATRSILYKYAAMLEQIQKFLSLPEEQRSNNKKEMEQIRQIEFQHVYYRYPNQEKYVLQDINFTLQAGAVTVLMGYNGAGKSTLLKILMGIYTNYEGVILVNGKNQRTWDIEQYRKKVSVLFQNYIKYETSIAENIWYGNLHNDALKQQMPTVLEAYGLSELSMETNQELGYQFCNGRQISLGQWQKLAVARCLVHAGDIFVFDEPNASLDLVSEEIIFRQILSETREKICLFVLHRFNHFVISADQILVLNEGKIWEKGTHLQLMKRNDIYAKLYYAQNGKDHSALTF